VRGALALVLVLLGTSAAHAASGGAAEGRVEITWAGGAATVALVPGEAARAEAVTLLRTARMTQPVRPEFVQGARLVALRAVRESTRPCEGGTLPVRREAGAIVQPLVPMYTDLPHLDLLAGTGTVELDHVTDNPGNPLPFAGEYFLPKPPIALERTTSPGCAHPATFDEEGNELSPASEDPPLDSTEERPAISTRGNALVPFGYALWLNEAEVRLRREGAAWRGTASGEEEGVRTSIELVLRGTPKRLGALCRVPGRQVARARSAAAALRLLRRAGFPNARSAGRKTLVGARRGRPFIEPSFTSSGFRECGLRRGPRVYTVR